MKSYTVRDYVHIALVAALYVVLTTTPPLNAISYGAYQFRVSEMLNFLSFYNRKYIWSVTLGCMIANAISSTSLGMIDVIVGGGSTLVFVTLGVVLFERYKGQDLLGGYLDKAHVYFAFFFAFSMFTIAAELNLILGLPFFFTWFTVAVGELASLLVGAVVIKKLADRLDFTA